MAGVGGTIRLTDGLVFGAVLGAVFLVPPLGLFFAPIPMAIYVALGRNRAASGLLGAAALGAFLAFESLGQTGLAVVTMLVAFPIGFGLRLRQRYGVIVGWATGLAFLFNVVVLMALWEEMSAEAQANHDMFSTLLERGDADEIMERGGKMAVTVYREMFGNWSYVYLGLTFSGLLLYACMLVSTVGWWLERRKLGPGRVGTFTRMRPPDGLIWVAILTAVLWFAEGQWPSDSLRMIGWNMAIALAGLYWLNGLAVLLYGVIAWKPPALVLVALVFVMLFGNLISLLSVVGLFDTWGEFRGRIDRAVAARKLREGSPDDRV